jgi:predicted ATPase
MNKPILKSLRISGLLSFGPTDDALPLHPLNVLIGPNGSGKSNTIEALALLQSAPRDLASAIRDGSLVADWLWKGVSDKEACATIEVVTRDHLDDEYFQIDASLRYRLTIREAANRLEVADERIENEVADPGRAKPYFYFGYENGRPMVNVRGEGQEKAKRRALKPDSVDPHQSILSQRKDPDQYPQITFLGEVFGGFRIYRDWTFGRRAPSRGGQPSDLRTDHLDEDVSNLGLVLSRFRRNPEVKRELLDHIRVLYDGIDDVEVSIEARAVQVFFTEGRFSIPATRLSDGTLRYLFLLAILLDPSPPPLVAIEEPEIGLHPDLLPRLADLLRQASERTQLIVTTHSDVLVDALTETPESVVVCEKVGGQTRLRRLDRDELKPWLAKYRLGELWTKGNIGGTRW